MVRGQNTKVVRTDGGGIGRPGRSQRRKPTHEIMQDISDSMLDQNGKLTQSMNKVVDEIKLSTSDATKTRQSVHDLTNIVDEVLYEQRVTNILLTELLAIQNVIIGDDGIREATKTSANIRANVYDLALGEHFKGDG